MSNLHSLPGPTVRISRKVREAIAFRVREGLSVAAAAGRAGLSRNGFAKALKRPAVHELLKEEQETFIRETEALRSTYKARALEVALDLMLNAKSETVRARMAEFLASDAKAPQVAVHVDARQQGGYDYVPPGCQLVEIVPTSHSADGAPKTG